VAKWCRSSSSVFNVAKKLSVTALSKQSATPPVHFKPGGPHRPGDSLIADAHSELLAQFGVDPRGTVALTRPVVDPGGGYPQRLVLVGPAGRAVRRR
jgi:hypothetical protein